MKVVLLFMAVVTAGANVHRAADPYDPVIYEFKYGVKDYFTGQDFTHTENRQGEKTTGYYEVALPDGRTQIVNYVADENGYTADVVYQSAVETTDVIKPTNKSVAPGSPRVDSKPSYFEQHPSYPQRSLSYSGTRPEYPDPSTSYSGPYYPESRPPYHGPRPVYPEPRPSYPERHPLYAEPRPYYPGPRPAYPEPQPQYHDPRPQYPKSSSVEFIHPVAPPHPVQEKVDIDPERFNGPLWRPVVPVVGPFVDEIASERVVEPPKQWSSATTTTTPTTTAATPTTTAPPTTTTTTPPTTNAPPTTTTPVQVDEVESVTELEAVVEQTTKTPVPSEPKERPYPHRAPPPHNPNPYPYPYHPLYGPYAPPPHAAYRHRPNYPPVGPSYLYQTSPLAPPPLPYPAGIRRH